jgi:hypothetical protein
MKRLLPWLGAGLLLACGSSGGAGDGPHGDMATAGDMAMGGGSVPDPGSGNGVDNNFGPVEPNDSPSTATPLGIAATGDVHVWVNNNAIGGADGADYFVFKSGPAPGQFTFNICWTGTIASMSATLWKVVGGQPVMPPIHQWASAGMCVMSAAMGDAPLEASTIYLFGVQASGGTGTYSA